MKLKLIGNLTGLETGIGILSARLGFETAEEGLPVKVEQTGSNIEVNLSGNEGLIRYNEKIHFFRALGLFIEALQQGDPFNITEEPQFEKNGIMIDVSRNSVMKVESIKKTIELMAVMGLNLLMLYTEDTYTIETRPYFGYMKGRYSHEELAECDSHADIFGIEMIPCIQTLAHMETALRWKYANDLKDTDDILLAGSEKTYAFIEEMIKAASTPFRSKRIHIGMDEAHRLGLGKYLDMNGYCNRFDIMTGHLARVRDIAHKYGLKPMIWSDMFFRLLSKTGAYRDKDITITDDIVEKVPNDVQLVYWDYYDNDEDSYTTFIRNHKKLRSDILFAGGIWTWNGNIVNYRKTFKITNSALEACKREGIKEVFATMWGDNGSETNFFSGLLGLQLYAEHGYARNLDTEKLKKRFKFCIGGNYDAFMDLLLFYAVPGSGPEDETSNPSEFLLWQDLLVGLFDRHAEAYDFPGHYKHVADVIEKDCNEAGEWRFVFEMPCKLALVLSMKSHLGLKMKECYEKKDRKTLEEIIRDQLPELRKRVFELKATHRQQWFKTYKPFGWEVLDIRYGGLLARIESAECRLADYVNGTINRIEELEQERLYFDGPEREEDKIGWCNIYRKIVTANMLG